eukprot:Colp12_sorted_trinity150504_noHs@16553
MATVVVGSTNEVKIEAVKEVLQEYILFKDVPVAGVKAASEVSEQPMSLEEIIAGAKNRAKNAAAMREDCKYAIGLESGLFPAPGTATGYLEACICAIVVRNEEGRFIGNAKIGISSGFEVPRAILDIVHNEGLDLSSAVNKAGLSTNPRLGEAEGLIGILTKGRVLRKAYTKQSITMAMLQLENTELYP